MKFKKNVVAVVLASSMMFGCSAFSGNAGVDYDQQLVAGNELSVRATDEYKFSKIKEGELVRTTVNTAFLVAKPMYEDYIKSAENQPEVKQFLAYTQNMSEEDREAAFNELDAASKEKVTQYVNSSVFDSMLSGLGNASKAALSAAAKFDEEKLLSLVTDSNSGLDFTEIMQEQSLYELTGEQVMFMNDSVISAYQTAKQLSALANAE